MKLLYDSIRMSSRNLFMKITRFESLNFSAVSRILGSIFLVIRRAMGAVPAVSSYAKTANIVGDEKPKSLVNSVIVYGQQKYLVMLDADVSINQSEHSIVAI